MPQRETIRACPIACSPLNEIRADPEEPTGRSMYTMTPDPSTPSALAESARWKGPVTGRQRRSPRRSVSWSLRYLLGTFALSTGLQLPHPGKVRAFAVVVSRAPDPSYAVQQRSILVQRTQSSDFLLEVRVTGDPEDWIAVVPLQSQPTISLQPFDTAALDQIWVLSQPSLVRADEGSTGCDATPSIGSDPNVATDNPAAPMTPPSSSIPSTQTEQDIVDGQDIGNLIAWLSAEGYVLSGDMITALSRYSGAGRYFLLLRKTSTDPDPSLNRVALAWHLDTLVTTYPLPLNALGVRSGLSAQWLVVGPSATVPTSPYTTLQLSDLNQTDAATDYYGTLTQAIDSVEGRAVMVEGVFAGNSYMNGYPLSTGLVSQVVQPEDVITRMHTRLSAERLRTGIGDSPITLQAQAGFNPPSAIQASIGTWGRGAIFNILSMLSLCALALRRRTRRRVRDASVTRRLRSRH